jgi:ADP-ribose pyrophosphatase
MASGQGLNLVWQVTDRLPAVDYDVFRIRRHVARHPQTGQRHTFSVLEGPDWVNVIALTSDDDVVLVRQFRHGTERVTLEVPGGCVDPGESPLQAARRELREETGYTAASWRLLGRVEPNPAIQTNACHVFLALEAQLAHDQEPDPAEVMAVERQPLGSMGARILAGDITHALVVAAFGLLVMHSGGWRRPGD